MKYYGYIYKGPMLNYKFGEQAFSSPYEALNYANQQWQNNPDLQVARLLVVKKDDCVENVYAFFQFTSYNACVEFIKNNTDIVWSNINSPKWNGNAKMMG